MTAVLKVTAGKTFKVFVKILNKIICSIMQNVKVVGQTVLETKQR